MRVRPCQGVEYCAIYVTYARPTYSDRGVESPQKSIYIEAYGNVFTFF